MAALRAGRPGLITRRMHVVKPDVRKRLSPAVRVGCGYWPAVSWRRGGAELAAGVPTG